MYDSDAIGTERGISADGTTPIDDADGSTAGAIEATRAGDERTTGTGTW